jgi:peptidyl-tRNA hydrolase
MVAGAMICQAVHAARQYAEEHPFIESRWWRESNTLAVLEAPLEELHELHHAARSMGVSCSRFVEPDWSADGTLTAVVLGPDGRSLTSDLPLARP